MLVDTVMVGEGANRLVRDKDLAGRRGLVEAAYGTLLSTTPGTQHDLFGAFATLGDD